MVSSSCVIREFGVKRVHASRVLLLLLLLLVVVGAASRA